MKSRKAEEANRRKKCKRECSCVAVVVWFGIHEGSDEVKSRSVANALRVNVHLKAMQISSRPSFQITLCITVDFLLTCAFCVLYNLTDDSFFRRHAVFKTNIRMIHSSVYAAHMKPAKQEMCVRKYCLDCSPASLIISQNSLTSLCQNICPIKLPWRLHHGFGPAREENYFPIQTRFNELPSKNEQDSMLSSLLTVEKVKQRRPRTNENAATYSSNVHSLSDDKVHLYRYDETVNKKGADEVASRLLHYFQQSRKNTARLQPLRRLYEHQLPITATKFEDLQVLKQFCPTEAQDFYTALPHEGGNGNAHSHRSTLLESDSESEYLSSD
ncbi:hypothetical protein RRG08_040535 [Elysia crispata]|uniref:Uncharacterized protein n=1 Tax=Elysia crispata TaxID=231223 RepID=A0AAE1D9G1_9GAST|nr:hypothetical protein RRG08_040535 [Elysia crispata]